MSFLLLTVFNMYTPNLFVAVVCPDAPEKPRGGKWFWSDKNKNGTFGTTIDYECGPYAKFQAPNTTDFYQKTSSSCQWDKTWTKSKLDPCICKYLHQLSQFLYYICWHAGITP